MHKRMHLRFFLQNIFYLHFRFKNSYYCHNHDTISIFFEIVDSFSSKWPSQTQIYVSGMLTLCLALSYMDVSVCILSM